MSAEVGSGTRNGNTLDDDHDAPRDDLSALVASDDDEDLFGDGEDDDAAVPDPNSAPGHQRTLDDAELDSADDENRNDRVADTVEDTGMQYDDEQEEEQRNITLSNVDMARIKPPQGDELYFLNIPDFVGVKHTNFEYKTFEPPSKPHDERDTTQDGPDMKFSPFSTANTSIYWRRDPQDPDKVQSNARIVRWSDGSLTLQIASKPTEQYRISTTAMRPGWPKKREDHTGEYDARKETNYFLAAPHDTVGLNSQIVAPFDASMKLQPTGNAADEAEIRLKAAIASTQSQNEVPATFRSSLIDPNAAKRNAEKTEKDIAKARRQKETAEDRNLNRRDGVLRRGGMGRSGGLTVGGLEGDMPTARGRKSGPGMKKRRINRHGDIYSDDESEAEYRRRGRDDEYDHEDDFLANSDEEPEVYGDDAQEVTPEEEDDDPDRDDLSIEGRETTVQGRTRGGARDDAEPRPKKRPARDDDGDQDAEAEDDDDIAALPQPVQRKQRRVLSDDEDE